MTPERVLPQRYRDMTDTQVAEAIEAARRALGRDLTILGHHYQRDEVIRHADFRGDSLDLSRRAAAAREARYIVFCGVHFMAETAAILCAPGQTVVQPVIEALCPMAAMANATDAAQAYAALTALWGGDLTPITYQNSVAAVKAFVGQHGGAVCTSSNAERLFRWALSRSGHVLFLPDEHLGTNTALAMGIPREAIGVWDHGTLSDPTALAHCRVIVWKGYCYVHTAMTVEDVVRARRDHPEAIIVVHPECPYEVVALADRVGSTTGIIEAVEAAPAGATLVVGTEWHLVNRLSHEHADKRVYPLRRMECRTMAMTTARDLLYALDDILAGTPHHVVTVEEDTAHWARVALERMLDASGRG